MDIHEKFPGFLLPETEQLIKACSFTPHKEQHSTEYENERITNLFSLAAQYALFCDPRAFILHF